MRLSYALLWRLPGSAAGIDSASDQCRPRELHTFRPMAEAAGETALAAASATDQAEGSLSATERAKVEMNPGTVGSDRRPYPITSAGSYGVGAWA